MLDIGRDNYTKARWTKIRNNAIAAFCAITFRWSSLATIWSQYRAQAVFYNGMIQTLLFLSVSYKEVPGIVSDLIRMMINVDGLDNTSNKSEDPSDNMKDDVDKEEARENKIREKRNAETKKAEQDNVSGADNSEDNKAINDIYAIAKNG